MDMHKANRRFRWAEVLGWGEEQMSSWHSYPSIYALGHRAITDLLTVPVYVEEKIDGSQFSFMKDESGDLHLRSKGSIIHADAPEKMFARAVESVQSIAHILHPGWTYRAEYLAKPKHNTLAYSRVPVRYLAIFDVNTAEESYLSYPEKSAEAERLGMEAVPLLYEGLLSDAGSLRALLDTTSFLGGQKIEGVVIKQQAPTLFGPDKKALIGKFVSEAFKEIHGKEWRKSNPTHGDIIVDIATQLKTPARWHKALIHLRERDEIEDSPRDIGKLIKEVPADIRKECEQEVRDQLFAYAWPKISRMVVAGIAEWYKERLAERQFEHDTH